MKGVPVARYLNTVWSAGSFQRAKLIADFQEQHHIHSNQRSRWANKPGAHHKVNPAGTKMAEKANDHKLTVRW